MHTYRKKSKFTERLTVLLLVLCIALSLCSCRTKKQKTQEEAEVKSTPEEKTVKAKETSADTVTRFLVLGRDRAVGLTDSILLVSVREETGSVSILQIPRDTYAEYTDKEVKKLNAAYASLGMDGLKSFLSEALGVQIDYAVAVELDTVREIVDAVGGVEITLEKEIDFRDANTGKEVHLPAGTNRLDGETAEYFVRYRSGYADADLGRMKAQKQFLQNLTLAAQKMDFAEQIRTVMTVLPKVQTDLPLPKAIAILRILSSADLSAIPMETAPGEPIRAENGAWYYCLDREKMREAVNAYLMPKDPVTDEIFDPKEIFDCKSEEKLHKIYTSERG